MSLILLCPLGLSAIPEASTLYPAEIKMATYPIELLEWIRDSIADCTKNCKNFVDEELRAERKYLHDSIPLIFAGINTSKENSALAKNLSNHILTSTSVQ